MNSVSAPWSKFSTTTGVVSIIVTVLLVLVFARLGLWQLSRAAEKEAMLEAKVQAGTQARLNAINEGLRIEDLVYRQVEISGQFDYARQFLLDNRIHNKQAGYEVITPFYPAGSDGFILVNRGWFGHNGDRSKRPIIPAPTDRAALDPALEQDEKLFGLITNPSKGFVLGEALAQETARDGKQNWPLVLQYIDYATIADKVDKIPLISGVVVANQGQNADLLYNWQPVANGPMKHYGYAFQWFAMLTAVIAFFIYLNFVKKSDE